MANSAIDMSDRGQLGAEARGRILVVEDDFFLGIMAKEALNNAGFIVIGIATDAEQALTLTSRQAPDLVLMDIRLAHGDDGVDTAIALFEEFGVRSIFVSAHADDATQSRARKARPLGWLVKPFRLEELATVVKKALATGE
jgi:DNA-binding response OmpR family regulator